MHTKSAMKRTISCTSKSAWKFIFFLVESVIWDRLLERTTRGNSEVNPLPAKPPNCRAAIFVFLIHQWLSVYKLAPGPLVLEEKPWTYRKIPGLTFFKDPFWGAYIRRGLSMEGTLRVKIDWVSLLSCKKIYRFCFVLLCIWGPFSSQYKPPRGLYLEGRFNGGFFGLRVWGAYIWRSLYMEGLIFGILRYLFSRAKIVQLKHNNHQMLKP